MSEELPQANFACQGKYPRLKLILWIRDKPAIYICRLSQSFCQASFEPRKWTSSEKLLSIVVWKLSTKRFNALSACCRVSHSEAQNYCSDEFGVTKSVHLDNNWRLHLPYLRYFVALKSCRLRINPHGLLSKLAFQVASERRFHVEPAVQSGILFTKPLKRKDGHTPGNPTQIHVTWLFLESKINHASKLTKEAFLLEDLP